MTKSFPLWQKALGPLFHPIFNTLFRFVHRLRWCIIKTLQTKLVPSNRSVTRTWGMRQLEVVSIGHLFLSLPLLVMLFIGYEQTFINPSVSKGGYTAAYCLIYVFLTANKINSIFYHLFGISYERLVPYHKVSAVLCVILSCMHGYVVMAKVDKAFCAKAESSDVVDSLADPANVFPYGIEVNAPNVTNNTNNVTSSNDDNDDNIIIAPVEMKLKYAMWHRDFYVTGCSLTVCLVVLVLTSYWRFILRKWNYELWLVTHVLVAIATFVFCYLHYAPVVLVALIWWIFDLLLRYVLLSKKVVIKHANLRKVTHDIVEISFPNKHGEKGEFVYNAGQFARICIPEISGTVVPQFHPVTISSAPHEEQVTFHIRAVGNWTNKLFSLASDSVVFGVDTHKFGHKSHDKNGCVGCSCGKEVTLWLEGPYGEHTVDLDSNSKNDNKYSTVICISGGVGVTPNLSLSKQLLHEHEKGDRSLDKIFFVWSVRDNNMLRKMLPKVFVRHAAHSLANNSSTSLDATFHGDDSGSSGLSSLDLAGLDTDSDSNESSGSTREETDQNESDRIYSDIVTCHLYNTSRNAKKQMNNDFGEEEQQQHSELEAGNYNNLIHGCFEVNLDKRPDLRSILIQAKAFVQVSKRKSSETKIQRVLVSVCGPAVMVEQCRQLCRKFSDVVGACRGARDESGDVKVVFDLHQEVFEY